MQDSLPVFTCVPASHPRVFLLLKDEHLCWIGSGLRVKPELLSSNSVVVSEAGWVDLAYHPQGEHLIIWRCI